MQHFTRALALGLFAMSFAACGVNDPSPEETGPQITYFGGSSATVPAGGGSVTLSWSKSTATSMAIDNGVGNVTGLTSKVVTVKKPTSFILTAIDDTGTTQKGFTVTIASKPGGGGATGGDAGATGGASE